MVTGVDYRRVFEAAYEAQLLIDREARVVAVSDAYLRAVCHAREQVVGRAIFELPPYASAPAAAHALREALPMMQRSSLPTFSIDLDGAPTPGLWSRAKLFSIFDTAGQLEHIIHTLEASSLVVERTESDSERRLRKLIEQTYDVIALFDSHGRNFYVSPAIERLMGFKQAEFGAINPFDNIHPDDRAIFGQAILKLLQSPGGHMIVRFRGQHKVGHWVNLENAAVNRLHDPDVAAIVSTFRDVTEQVELQTERQRLDEERRLLELRAQESQKLESLGVLAGGIAHDFNNLLMVILGSVSLVRAGLGDAHPMILHVEQMEEASRRATDLCRKLLAYAGKGRFSLQSIDLNQLIEDTTHLLQVAISKKAQLRFQLDPELPPIAADTAQMHQVLMNLVINASDAIGDRPGTITIHTGRVRADRAYLDSTFLAPDIPPGDFVYLEVSDTGSGMSLETQARIFEPFFTTKFTGRGLGLSAVLGIVRGHGGALKVYSEPAKGTSFKFLLPVATAKIELAPTKPPSLQPLVATGRVLIVDDEVTVRAVASELLERLGFESLLACDGHEAIRVYLEHRDEIACVLMDLTMPTLDGVEALRELRRIDPDVRVLLMSGYNEQDASARFVGQGIAGFLQKPFTLAELERRLGQLLS